ncbi:MAG: YdcF family protein, partial [Novipirellula sp. JB048]
MGITGGIALNIILVAWTWLQNDAGLAARAATALVMPLGLLWTLTLVACLVCFVHGCRRCGMGFGMLFAFISLAGNGTVADAGLSSIEWPRTELATLPAPLRSVVVLGGGVGIAYDGVPELGRAGQRVMFAAQLWHAGKTQSILCTGGSPLSPIPPAAASRMLLESIAVPNDKLYESPGDNTSEEMKNLAAFLASPPDHFPRTGEIGLVTSASHMPRAIRLAADHGLDFIPLPCGF